MREGEVGASLGRPGDKKHRGGEVYSVVRVREHILHVHKHLSV